MFNDREPKEKKSSSRKHYFLLLAPALAIFVIAFLVWLWLYFQKPAETIVSVTQPYTEEEKKISLTRFESRYVSFSHQSSYEVKSHITEPDKVNITLESAYLVNYNASNSKKIALIVENLDGRTITDSANYNLRKTYPKKYHEEQYTAGKITGTLFTAQGDSYEKTLFIPRKVCLIEIALTGLLSAKNELDAELEEIIRSIDFK